MKNKESSAGAIRAAIYVRVSGEEQKLHGLSLESQQERLEQYAREKGWIITGVYIDAAKTARKRINKRTEFLRMIESVKRDEVDILLFTRLDRWFRNIADYYKVIGILEAHNCEWLTTDEEYDTTTANGRLYINVKLSIAQNEADITSERIGVVFDTKIAHGTVISGKIPYGYKIGDNKRLEIDEEKAPAVRDAFDHYENGGSVRATYRHLIANYGAGFAYDKVSRILHEKLYTGVYDHGGRFNENYAPAIIEKGQFDRVQEMLSRNIYTAPTGNVYLFTSLLVCADCGHCMCGHRHSQKRDYYYYRCTQVAKYRCDHKKSMIETYLEDWLFDHIGPELDRVETEYQIAAKKRRKNSATKEKAAIKGKLTRLKELYVNDLIGIDDYKKDYEIYTAALANLAAQPQDDTPPDFSAVRKLLDKDFRTIYNGLTREEKRTLWRSVIKEIRIDGDNNITSISFA